MTKQQTPLRLRRGSGNQSTVPDENVIDLRSSEHDSSADVTPAEPFKPPPERESKQSVPSANFLHEEKVVEPKPPRKRWRAPLLPHTQLPQVHRMHPSAKSLGIFASLLLIISIPLAGIASGVTLSQRSGTVLGASIDGATLLERAVNDLGSGQYADAEVHFGAAEEAFQQADTTLQGVGGLGLAVLRTLPIIGKKVESGQSLLATGMELSHGGKLFAGVLALYRPDGGNGDGSLGDAIGAFGDAVRPIITSFERALNNLRDVDANAVPEGYRDDVRRIQALVPALDNAVTSSADLVDLLTVLLGFDGSQRYLLLFQNDREMRPTGGFIGSVALVDIEDGRIRRLEVPGGGSYDIAGQLTDNIISPEPLHLVNPQWYLQDANWWPDVPTSANKIMWFYEKSGGPTVDGVMMLTTTVAEDLLRITGSIDLENEYGVTVSSENFADVVQEYVEEKYDPEINQPKAIIGDLVTTMFDRLFSASPTQLVPLLDTLSTELTDKRLLFTHRDQSTQKRILEQGWGGAQSQTDGDYLMVVNTNIAGGKTDGVIDTSVHHTASVQDDGRIVDTITVRRVHNGDPADPVMGIKNNDYVRLYVPQGSTLLSAEGFASVDPRLILNPEPGAVNDETLQEIQGPVLIDALSGMRVYDELGKTVFGNWMTVDARALTEATVTYELPIRVSAGGVLNSGSRYTLLIEKQPGERSVFYTGTIHLPSWASVRIAEPSALTVGADGTLTMSDDIDRELFYGVVIGRRSAAN